MEKQLYEQMLAGVKSKESLNEATPRNKALLHIPTLLKNPIYKKYRSRVRRDLQAIVKEVDDVRNISGPGDDVSDYLNKYFYKFFEMLNEIYELETDATYQALITSLYHTVDKIARVFKRTRSQSEYNAAEKQLKALVTQL